MVCADLAVAEDAQGLGQAHGRQGEGRARVQAAGLGSLVPALELIQAYQGIQGLLDAPGQGFEEVLLAPGSGPAGQARQVNGDGSTAGEGAPIRAAAAATGGGE